MPPRRHQSHTTQSPARLSPDGRSRAHLSSATDLWPTPQDFYDRLHAEFGFVVDVCATPGNAKAPAYYALDHANPARRDGLTQDWAAEAAQLGGSVWMNSPYGRPITAWLAKARQEVAAGATVVALVPVRADTQWWHEHVLGSGAEVRYVRGRLTFGDAAHAAAFASAVVIYRPTDTPGAPGPVTTMPAKSRNVRPAKTPDALIDNYWGDTLPPAQFALAEAVVKDTARSMGPTTPGQANLYLASLTAFLAGPCGWYRTSAPALRALLSEQAITTVTEAMPVADRTKVTRREVLHRVARRLGTMAPSTRNTTLGYPMHPDRFMVAGLPLALPVAALVQAHQVRHGAPLTDKGLSLALAASTPATTPDPSTSTSTSSHVAMNVQVSANAGPAGTGTVLDPATITALTHATGQEVRDIPRPRTPSTPSTPSTLVSAPSAPLAPMTPITPVAAPAHPSAPAASPAAAVTGKPSTRAQRKAFARQSYALAQAAAGRTALTPTTVTAPTLVDIASLDAAIVSTCVAFRPKKADRAQVWDANLSLAQRLLLGTLPPSARTASSYGSSLARFLAWFSAWPGRTGTTTASETASTVATPTTATPSTGTGTGAPITVEQLLAPGVVETFVRLGGLSARSAASYRSLVRRALDSVDPAPRRTKLAYRPGAAPYSPAELDRMVFLARNQRTPGVRAAVCGAIALGAGAGLDARDLRELTPAHLQTTTLPGRSHDTGTVTVVHVTVVHVPGPRPRTVPVRASFEDLLQVALTAHTALGKGEDDLLIGRKADRVNTLRPLTSRARTAAGEPVEVEQARLRNTWLLAAMCAPVPLAELMRAAGLTSPRPVENLLRYCPPLPEDVITAVLTALDGVPTGTGVPRGGTPRSQRQPDGQLDSRRTPELPLRHAPQLDPGGGPSPRWRG